VCGPLWKNHLRNEGSVASRSIGGFSTKRECANTHTKHINYVIKTLFKDYNIRELKMFQKIEHLRKRKHFSRSDTRWRKGIHLALKVKTLFGYSTPTTRSSKESNTQSLDFPLMAINGIAGSGERKKPTHKELQSKA
jgi:hypothetical protein